MTDSVLADNLVRINADAAGLAAGCLSENCRPQHRPTGEERPAEIIPLRQLASGNLLFCIGAVAPVRGAKEEAQPQSWA
jgi:hypothetical protein